MPRIPLTEVLGRVSRELDLLAAEAGDLDRAIAAGLRCVDAGGRRQIAHLQRADFLRQNAEDLAHFVSGVSSFLPDDISVDADSAAGGLQMRALARRLAGTHCPPGDESGDDRSGEVELL